jgi:hypothetical protein
VRILADSLVILSFDKETPFFNSYALARIFKKYFWGDFMYHLNINNFLSRTTIQVSFKGAVSREMWIKLLKLWGINPSPPRSKIWTTLPEPVKKVLFQWSNHRRSMNIRA